MLARLRCTVLALAIVVAFYFAYAVLVVPFIEPRVKPKSSQPLSAPRNPVEPQFHSLFPPGAWELNRPKVVETDQGTLLFADYKPLADGQMELTKCTVIAYIEQSVPEAEQPAPGEPGEKGKSVAKRRERRPIIIRAPQGATLKFDQELNVLRGEFGRLIGGQLSGEVTIHSPASSPTSDDQLEIVTKQVQIDLQKIWTPHEVQFRYGPNSGRGRILTIQLASAGKSGTKRSGLGITGVRSLELVHVDELRLLVANQGLFGQQRAPRADSEVSPPNQEATPVHVRSRGPLQLDIDRQIISLRDHVELTRLHATGVKDLLTCQLLEIHFAGGENISSIPTKTSKAVGKTAATETAPGKLTARRVVATGNPVAPVMIRAGSVGVGAQAERIEFDCILQRVWLRDSQKVMFQDPERAVEARELHYTLGTGNRLGELWARGPGQAQGAFGKEARRFQVAWQGEVRLRRIDNEPVLTFHSHVALVMPGLGQFSGDLVHLYLREQLRAETKDRVETTPDRLHAVGNVRVDSESWHATLHEVKMWFQPGPNGAPGSDPTLPADGNRTAPPSSFLQKGLLTGTTKQGTANGENVPPQSELDLRAKTLEAVVVLGTEPVVDLLILREGVELRELAPPEAMPLLLRGEHFELQDGASSHPRAALLGAPAELSARGMTARGPRFHMHPVDNYFEIVGAGSMLLSSPPSDGNPGQPMPPTTIDWAGQMQFDGQLARFERNVVVRGNHRAQQGDVTSYVATGDAIHAELTQRVNFQNPELKGPIDLAEAAFDGWGFLQVDMLDALGERKLVEQMQVLGLRVNQQSGDIRGHGPGWLRGVHRGKEMANAQPQAIPIAVSSSSGLSFLRIDFEREVVGNLHQQRLEFLNGTKTLYGPVPTWDDALDQEGTPPSPDTIRITCERLSVFQGGTSAAESIELEAVGNVFIQGELFRASGNRVSYARIKDQLILEGDGRNDARIEYFTKAGEKPTLVAADKLLYRPKTGHFELKGLRQSEISDLGQFRGRSSPQVRPR